MKVAKGADPELNEVSISSCIFTEINNREILNKVQTVESHIQNHVY